MNVIETEEDDSSFKCSILSQNTRVMNVDSFQKKYIPQAIWPSKKIGCSNGSSKNDKENFQQMR